MTGPDYFQCTTRKRTALETEFCKENGTVRVVFCTIAFGMGINVKGGNVVIHLGPSSGLDDYLQESDATKQPLMRYC